MGVGFCSCCVFNFYVDVIDNIICDICDLYLENLFTYKKLNSVIKKNARDVLGIIDILINFIADRYLTF